MTEEQKNLLLKDLCARLPHRIKASYYGVEEECETWDEIEGITPDGYVDIGQYSLPIECIKPYLFPLSSMTEEQEKEFDKLIELELKAISDEIDHTQATAFEVDFYNKHHYDWRGLIPLGLAIDATGLNIY
jgi:hypothetical protein